MKILVLKPNGGHIGFHMGVIQELVYGGFFPDKIIGSSSGAIAGFFAARQLDPAPFFTSFLEGQGVYSSPFMENGKFSLKKTISSHFTWRDIGILFSKEKRDQWLQRIQQPPGFATLQIAKYLLGIAEKHPLKTPFVIGLTNDQGMPVLIEFTPGMCEEDFLVDLVCQSAQYPIFNPHPHGIYTDGGLSSQNPAIPYIQKHPCERNHYLVSDPQAITRPLRRRKALYQLDAMQMIERSLDRTEERLFADTDHIRINPTLNTSRYDFSIETQCELIQLGAAEMRKLIPRLRVEWQCPQSQ